ncbi:MAG: hypothetical protein ABJA86_10560 [Nocardioidaceae bacterium]
MPRFTPIPSELRRRPFQLSDAVAAGVTPRMLQGRRFRRIHQGVWICADVELTTEMRYDAARLALPPGAIGSHQLAAEILDLIVPRASKPQFWLPESAKGSTYPGIRPHWFQEKPDSVTVHGREVTTAAKTFIDLATQLRALDLVVFGDSAVRRGWTTQEELVALSRERGRRHIRRARWAAALARAGVDSRPETLLRLLLVLAGLPEPETGVAVSDAHGGWIAAPDLSYPRVKIAIEYDGLHHFTDRSQRILDVARNANLIGDGWKVIVVLDHHLFQPARADHHAGARCTSRARPSRRAPMAYGRVARSLRVRPRHRRTLFVPCTIAEVRLQDVSTAILRVKLVPRR